MSFISRISARLLFYLFPLGDDHRTDRLVRRLVIANLIFLIYMTFTANDPKVIFTAILGGNAVGAIGGLLFAVPKQHSFVDAQQVPTGPNISANTSLEEVSDWLTKTIIGAGLVSWREILGQLDRSGQIVGRAVTDTSQSEALAGGVAVIVASSALGALIGYLWFARHWPGQLGRAQKSWKDIFASSGQKQELVPVAPDEPNLTPLPPPAASPPLEAAVEVAAKDEEAKGVAKQVAVTPPIDLAQQLRDAARLKYALMRSAPLFSHDWARGMFGGSSSVVSENFGMRTLSASVRTLEPDWFEITIEVVAEGPPPAEAIFFLHNTFAQPTPTAGFDSEGIARLIVTAYGAFTVGVLLDDGSTELELDLASIEGAPKAFISR